MKPMDPLPRKVFLGTFKTYFYIQYQVFTEFPEAHGFVDRLELVGETEEAEFISLLEEISNKVEVSNNVHCFIRHSVRMAKYVGKHIGWNSIEGIPTSKLKFGKMTPDSSLILWDLNKVSVFKPIDRL